MSAPTSRTKRGSTRQAVRVLAHAWRLWTAELPKDVVALVVKHRRGNRTLVSTVGRPTLPPGVCKRCGCTFHDPCIDGIGECCSWTNEKKNRCTFCQSGVRRQRSRKGSRR